MKFISRSGFLLLSVITIVMTLVGCGTYLKLTEMVPQVGNGWKREAWGSSIIHQCNGISVSVRSEIVQARRVAHEILFIPIPGTGEKEASPTVDDPFLLRIRFWPTLPVGLCNTDLVFIKSTKMSSHVPPLKMISEDIHQRTKGVVQCVFQFPPVAEIGDEFELHLSSQLLDCAVSPLTYRRNETTRDYSAFIP